MRLRNPMSVDIVAADPKLSVSAILAEAGIVGAMVDHYSPKTFVLSGSLIHLLKLSHDATVAAFNGRDLSFAQWLVLMTLREGAAYTASDLSREFRYDTGALTRLLSQLERRGFVKRQRSQKDRRIIELQLTADGRDKAAELLPLFVDQLNDMSAGFDGVELVGFTRLLNKLVANLSAFSR